MQIRSLFKLQLKANQIIYGQLGIVKKKDFKNKIDIRVLLLYFL